MINQTAVDLLRHETMDPENTAPYEEQIWNAAYFLRQEAMNAKRDNHYKQELRKQVGQDKTTRKVVDNLNSVSYEQELRKQVEKDKTTRRKVINLNSVSLYHCIHQ
jgi:hypothetical protein